MKSEPLHICYVEKGYPCPHGGGGAGVYVQVVGRELVRRGHKVSVVATECPDCTSYASDEGVNVYRLKRGSLHWWFGKLSGLKGLSLSVRHLENGWQRYRFIQNLHKNKHIDIAEFSEGGDFWHMVHPQFPYIVNLHGSRYTFFNQSGRHVTKMEWVNRKLDLYFIAKAHYVTSPSQCVLNVVQEEMKRKLKNSSVIPLPLDPKLELLEPKTIFKDPEKTVFFAARNDPVKGGRTLLQAVPLVHKKVPDVKFQFFGFEPDKESSLPEGVYFNTFLSKEELLVRYQEADICIIPSFWDNSPNTVYEAMAGGKAVVASRVGGIPELVEHGETGILVDPGNPQQLADAIGNLLVDKQKRISMGLKARKQILKLANLENNVDKRLSLYNEVIASFGCSS